MAPRQNLKILSKHRLSAWHRILPSQLISTDAIHSVNAGQDVELWLSVYLFRLPLDVLGAGADQPSVVIEEKSDRLMLISVSPSAAEFGIQVGMTLAMALSLNQDLSVYPRDPRSERCGLESLATRFSKISSRVALYTESSIAIEIRGSLRLFGGMDEVLRRLDLELNETAYAYKIGLAPTIRAAFWLAQSHEECMVYTQDSLVSALSGLPVQLVSQNSKQLLRMQRSGIHNLADLMRLPRDGVTRRFGAQVLKILDQALGKLPELVNSYKPLEGFYEVCEFYLPTRDLNRIRPAVTELLNKLQRYLLERQAAIPCFQCKLAHLDGSVSVTDVGCSHYANRAEHMLMLMEEHLQRWRLKADAVSVAIEASQIETFTPGQLDLLDPLTTTDQQSWHQLTEQFEARFGKDCMKRLAACSDHRPEHAYSMSEYCTENSAVGYAERPLWLLQMPKALILEQGWPQWHGALYLTRPYERIEQGWWDQRDVCRDYCVAHNNRGSKLWIYRDRRSKDWFLHGIFA